MKWKIADRKDMLTLFGIITLITGLVISSLVFVLADDYNPDVLGYEIINGKAYPIESGDSRVYQRDLQMLGGKMYVLIDEFQRWLFGLWHGKSLSVLIFIVSILISAGFFYAANNPSSDNK